MPTRGRRELAVQAVQCYLAQDYLRKELLILDDEDDPSFNWDVGDPPEGVFYFTHPERLPIAEKRNLLCLIGRGEYVAHFDSDDWSDPSRLTKQVAVLKQTGKAVTGFKSMLFYDVSRNQVSRYQRQGDYALGTSLVYRKSWWQEHRFYQDDKTTEDNQFVYAARDAGELAAVDGDDCMVARIHPGNTTHKSGYRPLALAALPAGFPR
jgi:glycosyltransferase involved in cell wall biosynthesis